MTTSDSELHLVNESCALEAPAPAGTLKDCVPPFGESEPENVSVCVDAGGVGGGGGGGVEVTTAVAAEVALAGPPLFVAVTATWSVEPTSPLCGA